MRGKNGCVAKVGRLCHSHERTILEKQEFYQIANKLMADQVFGETGESQKPMIKINCLPLAHVLKFWYVKGTPCWKEITIGACGPV